MDAGTSIATAFQGLFGYLNFSTGKPDPRMQAQFFKLWLEVAAEPLPWQSLKKRLDDGLSELHASGQAAFKDVSQALAVVDLALHQVPDAYRRHHADLLFHLSDTNLFQPGFLVRALEAVLRQQGPWDEAERIIAGTLQDLNDYLGHRPIAVLETRPRGEPYDHERLCPIALYLQGAGVAPGRYAALVSTALDVLKAVPPALLNDACLDLAHLDELALDPRAYDHNHPADRRPNYRFGEWDPHRIDNHGFFCRFVVRQSILDGLLERIQSTNDRSAEELLLEAGTVLAGTMLMASGVSGAGPDTHDSSVNLAVLMPRIARYRDTFYNQRLAAAAGDHGQRLRQEATATRQPFGGARQHINNFLAQNQAAQMQQRHLALLMAELGYPEAARRHSARVPVASLRLLAEIHIHLTTCRIFAQQGKLGEAAQHLNQAEQVMHGAIACGAMVDPWNILGFQALYPLFQAKEDSVSDRRVGDLLLVVERLLSLNAHLRSEAAAAGDQRLNANVAKSMNLLAEWWDAFATTAVADVRHISGRKAAEAADHVADALGRWHQRGETPADLAFWRQHLDRFRTPKSFAIVVEELLSKRDYQAAMGLLVNWLSQAAEVPLRDGEHSFHMLALRWMLDMCQDHGPPKAEELIRKFIDHLEANADDYWQVPVLERSPEHREHAGGAEDDEEDALYGAAYEGVTFKDSANDGTEGELLGFEPRQEFELEHEGGAIEERLQFLSTLARLFHLGSRRLAGRSGQAASASNREIVEDWLARAHRNYQDLLALLDAIHARTVPAPSGAHDSLVEFDRRNAVKQRLLNMAIGTCLDSALAVGSMLGAVSSVAPVKASQPTLPTETSATESKTKRPGWEPAMLELEQALWRADAAGARRLLPRFLEHFQHEPLLITPLHQGGNPRLILRAAIAHALLRALVANLPRIGLLRETYGLLRIAQTMEREQKLEGPRVTEFDRLYQIACQASVNAVVETVKADDSLSASERVHLLGRLVDPYLSLWAAHCRFVRRSVLEAVSEDKDWAEMRAFIRKYGGSLFHARFMIFGNLRGILQRGVGAYLRYLEENPDPQNPVALIDALDRAVPRAQAEQHLQIILQAVVENYEEYKDYNTSTSQSDYGENLYTLLDFLRLKAAYLRQAWMIWPLALVHEVLTKYAVEAAVLWQHQIERLTIKESQKYLARLAELEKEHGMRLRTVGDLVRERFVQPMAMDRVCALIEPAYDEARTGQSGQTLQQLEKDLQPYLDAPTGSGLDVPAWLGKLQAELQRVQLRRTAVANLAENLMQVPGLVLPVEQLEDQLEHWPKP